MNDLEPFIATVCWFDVPTEDGRLIRSGALSARRLPLPVMAPSQGGMVVVGQIEAYDISPEELVVMGMADPDAMPIDTDGTPIYGVGMDLTGIVVEFDEPSTLIFTEAQLAAISVTPSPAFPKAALRFEEWR